MENIKEKLKTNNLLRIAKGTIISFLITIILLIILAAILTYTAIQESITNPAIIVITVLSILIGSFISTIKIDKNGMIKGGTVGFLYTVILYIVSSIVSGNLGLSIYSIIMMLFSIIAGMIGGIIGVNFRK